MNNLVPLPYSRISVQTVDVALDETSIKGFLCGKEAYFETDHVVLRRGGECAVVSVHKTKADGLFWQIDDVEILPYLNPAVGSMTATSTRAIRARSPKKREDRV